MPAGTVNKVNSDVEGGGIEHAKEDQKAAYETQK